MNCSFSFFFYEYYGPSISLIFSSILTILSLFFFLLTCLVLFFFNFTLPLILSQFLKWIIFLEHKRCGGVLLLLKLISIKTYLLLRRCHGNESRKKIKSQGLRVSHWGTIGHAYFSSCFEIIICIIKWQKKSIELFWTLIKS